MYDLESYLGKMSSSFVTEKKIKQSKFGKSKKKKRNKVPSQANFHQQFHVNWEITEDDLP